MKEGILKHYEQLKRLNNSKAIHPKTLEIDDKTHVLFLHCLMNLTGIYRTYLPYLLLNKTSTHSAIIANLHKYDYTKKFKEYELVLNQSLLLWSDIIVLPPLFFDSTELMATILRINPKLQVYMDIPYNYFSKELKAPDRATPEELSQLMFNMNRVDNVLFASSKLKNYFDQQVKKYLKKTNFGLAVVPSFLSPEFIKVTTETPPPNNKLRIGILGSEWNETFAKEISTIALEFAHEVQLVVYGKADFKISTPDTITIEHQKTVSPLDHFKIIDGLRLDVFLLAKDEADDLNIKSELLFGELALLGIPILCNSLHACGRYIKDGENGFVLQAEQTYRDALRGLIARKDRLASIGKNAQLMTKKHLCWNTQRAEQLQRVFALGRS